MLAHVAILNKGVLLFNYCANYTWWQRSFTLKMPDVAAVCHQELSRLPRGRAREINKFPTAESTSTPCEFRWLKRISRLLDALVIKKMITLLYSIRRSTVISMFEPVFNKRQLSVSQWMPLFKIYRKCSN